MFDLSDKVPEGVVVATFSGVMAVSPSVYQEMLEGLALQHDVPCDEIFKGYVAEVLSKQPQVDFD